MARLPRIYIENAVYYITCKGDGHQHIFKDSQDFKFFLDLLKRYKEQYDFKVFAYCLLAEHFHLLLEIPPQKEGKRKMGALSNIMHDLNSSYTKYYNARYSRKGHLFRERYRACLAEKETYLLKLCAYIHLNPQRLGIVSHPEQYPYSSYGAYAGRGSLSDAVVKEEKNEILALLGPDDYAGSLARTAGEGDFLSLHNLLRGGILGSRDFEEKAKQALSSYTKEKSVQPSGNFKKGMLISLFIVLAGIGLVYTLRTVQEQAKAATAFPFKFPDQVKELLRDMEGTEWQIRIVSLDKGKVRDDVIRFEDGKLISRNFLSRDYPAAEYFLIIGDDDKITWESMQAGPEAEALWKGEIKKGEMEGGLRLRYADSKVEEFSFVSTGFRKK